MLIGVSSLSYLAERDDIVWAVVRNHSDSASWERLVFGLGALMLLGSAVPETWANSYLRVRPGGASPIPAAESGHWHQMCPARVLSVLAVGLLLPLSGAVTLLVGETVLILRLFSSDDQRVANSRSLPSHSRDSWGRAFRAAASKWGLTVSMILFVWTLQDRLAEIGAVCSMILWLVVNVPERYRSKAS
jgi:hypothetical protein